jgi:L,D-peptidoglycan transpeptidase YkuD (ErfK/YbiS/YcfS/YnhG family)
MNRYVAVLRPILKWMTILLVSARLLAAPADDTLTVSRSSSGVWVLAWQGKTYRCAVGRSGVAREGEKREGDGRTPAGVFTLRRVYYRSDRIGTLRTALPSTAMTREDGWCDDPDDPLYNRPVHLPYPGHHEELWRDKDSLYDLVVAIGYNDEPVVPGLGSAIFIHVAGPGYPSTAGCVALSRDDLLEILERVGPACRIRIVAQIP